MKKTLSILSAILLVVFMVNAANALTVGLDDNKDSTYEIDLKSQTNDTWNFSVSQIKGRALSHWSLGFLYEGSYIDMSDFIDYSGTTGGVEVGEDGSTRVDKQQGTGYMGVKWNTEGGDFTVKINYDKFAAAYDVSKVSLEVMAKAGTQHSTASVTDPAFIFDNANTTTPVEDTTPATEPATTEPAATEEPAGDDTTTGTEVASNDTAPSTTPAEPVAQPPAEEVVTPGFEVTQPAAEEAVNNTETATPSTVATGTLKRELKST